ncbi:hypothetical protein H5410_058174 [Solanum commersonii]|uniref:Uncharacterized protein n=1 Tax=Solanum commersonii TaxID=4109 RepID=A0A9J5WSS4_SOLCO|nr:hypothetical protein H5410_058174 [Solanum commersonii]
MEQVQSLKGKGTIQQIHTSTQTSKPSCPSHDKMDEQGVHSPTNAKRSTVSDNKDTAGPVQTVAGKDTSNPFMAVILPKDEDEDEGCSSSRRRLVPDMEHITTERERMNTSARRDSSGNNNRSLSSGEDDYGDNAYYQDAQDPNDDDDSGMSFDSIALHNLDT